MNTPFQSPISAQQPRYMATLLPLLIGIGAFLVYVGPIALNPQQIQWLGRHDFLQSYFGWDFFRSTEWTFPLGANPRYGYDVASSIVYSDSIPLFAIPFKLLAPILSTPFQYFGIWLLCCYVLQAVIGWKLAGLYTQSTLYLTGITLLLVSSPIILWHLDMTHIALAGHFVILLALYLNVGATKHKAFVWTITVVCSALIHFYLLVIVSALWVANLLDQLLADPRYWKSLGTQFILTVAGLLFFAWQAGYFMVAFDSVADNSFGNYSMNLFSIVDSRGYSLFFKGIPQSEYFDEGFNYLGLGGIFLLIAAIPSLWILKKSIWQWIRTHPFLCASVLILFLLSLTHQVHYGARILHIPLPESLINFLSIVRCSGRLFWPLYYVLLLAPAILVFKTYARSMTLALMVLAVIMQFIDIAPLRIKVRNNLMHPAYEKIGSNLKSEFWNIAAQKYTVLVARPVGPYHKSWATFGDYIDKNNMWTNIVCLARVSTQKVKQSQDRFDLAIYGGQSDASTLYLIENAESWKLWRDLPALKFNHERDLLIRVDGYTVLAPGWKTCPECLKLDTSALELKQTIPEIKLGQVLVFNKLSKDNDLFLLEGWHHAEDWGIWANGNNAEAVFSLPSSNPKPRFLSLEMAALVNPTHPRQEVEIWSNGALIAKQTLTQRDGNIVKVPIPEGSFKKGYLDIAIKSLNAIAVNKITPSSPDSRELSIGLVKAYFQ